MPVFTLGEAEGAGGMGDGGGAEQTLPRFFSTFLKGTDHYEVLKISLTFICRPRTI